jgi:hypothetical protein
MVSSACAAVLSLLALTLPAQASDSLLAELAGLAKRLKVLVGEQKADGITVRGFSGPPRLGTSGPGIQDMLTQALQAQGVTVKEDAALYIEGQFALVNDPDDKERERSLIRLEVRVRDALGSTVSDLPLLAAIRNNEDIVRITAPTVNLQNKSNADGRDRNKAIKKALVTPGVFIEGSQIKASKDGLYSVEVLLGEEARQAKNVKGQAFVSLKKGDVYAVKVTNHSKHEAAVSLTIDGLSVFAFSTIKNKETGRPRYTHFIVPARESMVIQGWHRNNEQSLSFKVVDFKDSALAKTGGNVRQLRNDPTRGTLTVCFHMAWSGDMPDGARESGPPATGFGPPKEVKLEEVQRKIGVLREAVSIRYLKSK